MEKKEYMKPQMKAIDMKVKPQLMAGSGVTSDDIGYGGIASDEEPE